MTAVVDDKGRLSGVFTDGDLRRILDKGHDIHQTEIGKVMTKKGLTIQPDLLAAEALKIMNQYKITCLIVVDKQQVPLGVVHMYDLIRAGLS